MKTVTVGQLIPILSRITSAQAIGFSALVSARARKTGNPFADIAKLSRISAFTGINWENSVNRQLVREGSEANFTESTRAWGARVSPALVEKDGKFYLVAKVERAAKPVYLAKKSAGNPWQIVSKSTVAAFLPEYKPANVGTAKDLTYRNYALSNLTRISLGGEVYRIRH